MSASAYCERASGRRSARAVEDERLLAEIRRTHKKNYEAYGYRRMWIALKRAGEQVGRGHVHRLMREGGKRRGRPSTTPDPEAHRRPDLVERDFSAEGPNELWVADLSYLRCWEGVLFIAFVIDVFSRMIVGWQLASHMRTDLAANTPRSTTPRRSPTTASWPRLDQLATPTTTRWPRASSTPSRPS